MVTIVLLNMNGSLIRVECDGIARDNIIRSNIVMTGCKELDTDGRDNRTFDTKVFSVHESLVLSYAVGRYSEVEVPAPAPAVAPEVAPVVVEQTRVDVKEDEAAAERRREARIKIDQEARERRNLERAKKEALRIAEEAAAAVKTRKPRRTRKDVEIK